jgi:hypothetical protein
MILNENAEITINGEKAIRRLLQCNSMKIAREDLIKYRTTPGVYVEEKTLIEVIKNPNEKDDVTYGFYFWEIIGQSVKPLFKHYCNECVFLGNLNSSEQLYDLYFCRDGGSNPTVIARYGNEDHEFLSGIYGNQLELVEAKKRALFQKLITSDELAKYHKELVEFLKTHLSDR